MGLSEKANALTCPRWVARVLSPASTGEMAFVFPGRLCVFSRYPGVFPQNKNSPQTHLLYSIRGKNYIV